VARILALLGRMGGESRFVLDAVDAKVNIQSNPAKSNKDEKNTFV
jgi:hypothetical protein